MDSLCKQIHANAQVAIPAFRQIHKRAIKINLSQPLGTVGSLGAL